MMRNALYAICNSLQLLILMRKNDQTAEWMTHIFCGAHAWPSCTEGGVSRKKKILSGHMSVLRHYLEVSNLVLIILSHDYIILSAHAFSKYFL